MIVHNDCILFKGDITCKPYKKFGYHYIDCSSYNEISDKILIIKLFAFGVKKSGFIQ